MLPVLKKHETETAEIGDIAISGTHTRKDVKAFSSCARKIFFFFRCWFERVDEIHRERERVRDKEPGHSHKVGRSTSHSRTTSTGEIRRVPRSSFWDLAVDQSFVYPVLPVTAATVHSDLSLGHDREREQTPR